MNSLPEILLKPGRLFTLTTIFLVFLIFVCKTSGVSSSFSFLTRVEDSKYSTLGLSHFILAIACSLIAFIYAQLPGRSSRKLQTLGLIHYLFTIIPAAVLAFLPWYFQLSQHFYSSFLYYWLMFICYMLLITGQAVFMVSILRALLRKRS